jgi:AcrR family transcriptional regulator
MAKVPGKTPDLSPEKRRQILVGARQVFIERGYERASVAEMAGRAGVSKATVYNHFADKEELFLACLEEESAELRAEIDSILKARSGDLEQDLLEVGEKLLRCFISPTMMALHRIIVAEVPRFPEVGRRLYDMIQRYMSEHLGAHLKEWSDRGVLRVEDPLLAAKQFVDLCKGDAYMRVELGIAKEITDEEARATVAGALRTFSRAYRA